MSFLKLTILSLLSSLAWAFPTAEPDAEPLESRQNQNYPFQLIYQLPPGIAPENAFLRSSNELLVTCLTCSTIRLLNPNLGPTQQPKIVYDFLTQDPGAGVIDVLGIDQLYKDVFVVAVGAAQFPSLNATSPGVPVIKGPTGVRVVDLRQYFKTYDSSTVRTYSVGGSNTGGLYDGVAVISASKGLVGVTDFVAGTISLINILKNTTTVIAGPTSILPPGSLTLANGMKYKNGRLYFTASTTGTYGYIPVSSSGIVGPPVTVFNYGFSLDDFAIAPSGNTYFTTFADPNGGILLRKAGTPNGQRGTTQIANQFATNSIIPVQKGNNCELLLTLFLRFQVGKVVIPGKC